MVVAKVGMVSLDCADPIPLAEFWAALLGCEVMVRDEEVSVVQADGFLIGTMRVPGYQPPTWPGGATPKHMHLDLAVRDLDEAGAEAVRLGARLADEQPQPDQWHVYLDPAGHPFCLTPDLPF
jgi:hypothetical protein